MRPSALSALNTTPANLCGEAEVTDFNTGESPTQTKVAAAGTWLASFPSTFPKAALATSLTALAGFTDAVGYSALGHLYLSFMSGNSTHLGMSLAKVDWSEVFFAGSIVAMFVAGSALGTMIGDRATRALASLILGSELLIVLSALLLLGTVEGSIGIIPIAGAMGMQNVLHQVISGADIGKGFVTGNLFALGQSLARLNKGGEKARPAMENAISWCSFIAGVCLGTLIFARFGLTPALGIVAIVLVILIIVVRMR
jgi:uncharacterized membrane protein YoaK (UPF0700 family)